MPTLGACKGTNFSLLRVSVLYINNVCSIIEWLVIVCKVNEFIHEKQAAKGPTAHAEGYSSGWPLSNRWRANSHITMPAVTLTLRLCLVRSEEHTSELQSRQYLVCRLL